ncbi:hypothetical protein AVEN_27102-1 [Araneus ventricosus]|uniref:Uncharacterized protein n=1 Tax=Araneus ventricosus TaxID=182803 RepID=A0A4Y2RI30_ARAVE|nr:hypothetical protein AVEN_27102-1 [Araneus ventricosus]
MAKTIPVLSPLYQTSVPPAGDFLTLASDLSSSRKNPRGKLDERTQRKNPPRKIGRKNSTEEPPRGKSDERTLWKTPLPMENRTEETTGSGGLARLPASPMASGPP